MHEPRSVAGMAAKQNGTSPAWGWAGGIAMGVALGTSIGVAQDNLALGLGIGVSLGICFSLIFGAADTRRNERTAGGDEETDAQQD